MRERAVAVNQQKIPTSTKHKEELKIAGLGEKLISTNISILDMGPEGLLTQITRISTEAE